MTKWLGLKEPKLCLSASLETRSIKGDSVNFDFGTIKKGFIWSFPKADGYSLSIAAMRGDKPKDIKKMLADYATKCGADLSVSNVRKYPRSLWDGDRKLHSQNALAGEAASLADPLPVRGFDLPLLADLRLLRRSIELLEVPARLRSSILKRSPKNGELIWFGPVAWLGHSISLLELLTERASNCRSLLSRSAKFCAANCVMPISLTAALKS